MDSFYCSTGRNISQSLNWRTLKNADPNDFFDSMQNDAGGSVSPIRDPAVFQAFSAENKGHAGNLLKIKRRLLFAAASGSDDPPT